MSIKVFKTAIAAGVIAFGATDVAQGKSPVPGRPGPLNIVDTVIAANAPGGAYPGMFDTLLATA